MTVNETLGMNTATATHQLKMNMMFSLAERLDLTHCYKCDTPIESARDMSLDHKEPWRNVSPDLFWDLDNLAFTHKWCNKVDRPARIASPQGQARCGRCKTHKPFEEFGSDSNRWNGVSNTCLACGRDIQRRYNERNPRHSCPECKTPMRKKCPSCKYEMSMKDYMALRRKEGVKY